MQDRLGDRPLAERNAAVLSTAIPPWAMAFVPEQRLLALVATDAGGNRRLWNTLVIGAPGFLDPLDGTRVRVTGLFDLLTALDPVAARPERGAMMGLLIIDLATRKRLRLNGEVDYCRNDVFELAIAEAFPNCTRYIQRREIDPKPAPASSEETPVSRGIAPGPGQIALIHRADTCFVGSRHPDGRHDVGHRGGDPGFLQVLPDGRIRIPDYPGNGMYQSFGNFHLDPRAAMCIPDFLNGRLLQLTGTATLEFDAPEDPRQPTGGTGRYWTFTIAEWIERPLPELSELMLCEMSPANPKATSL
jgi:hypothetical protein